MAATQSSDQEEEPRIKNTEVERTFKESTWKSHKVTDKPITKLLIANKTSN